QRFMKNFADGNQKTPKTMGSRYPGQWIWLAMLLVYTPKLSADFPRSSWILEGLTRPPASTEPLSRRFQLGVATNGFADCFSNILDANLDFRYFEIRLRGVQNIYLNATDTGRSVKTSLDALNSFVGAELARYAVASTFYFGRLSLGYYH